MAKHALVRLMPMEWQNLQIARYHGRKEGHRMAGISLNGVYNHFIQDYVSKDMTHADAHRKDELRDVYKSIAKHNKQSPLYLLNQDDESRNDAIDIKERARELQGNIFSLSDQNDRSSLNHTSAYTTDTGRVVASYIGKTPEQDVGNVGFDIEVMQLASIQVNKGRPLELDAAAVLPEGNYAFDVKIAHQEFEFQFSVYDTDKNIDVLQKLERLIGKADIGLSARVTDEGDGLGALERSSHKTGITEGSLNQFDIYETSGDLAKGSVNALGLDNVYKPASNAVFTLNGEEKTAVSNHFTVGSKFDIQLSSVTNAPIHVGVMKDNEALRQHIVSIINSYHNFVTDSVGIDNDKFKSDRVKDEAIGIAKRYMTGCEDIGLSFTSDGTINIDDELLKQAVEASLDTRSVASIKGFTDALIKKAKDISVDPMKYIDRPVVNYKNPDNKENVASPYITSEYSGMMFNNYC